ncbi:M81 family metallopeptidase [Nitratireductor aquimarinus]|uniref:M81 family metallopeptidase n=1 Tax=Nitratireductor aquimarinus TaxID=889300 RepID=UPI001A8E04B8|nr:M81 family metallopeptidase [Nitratireductor aquimarinus]MBN8245459.1 M81 family metallopeptidase [Nitratireductor aquimarinus]MBY6133844.1 M81 family metallopeptidase [Nitratireductor aquimarinus]MCA1304931.1 M81 family metallopeptidase [Nitratireductor aquimarinus]
MKRRVALAGFLHETNTFAPSPATYAHFEQGGGYLPLSRGNEIIERSPGVNLGISGAVAHAQKAGWEIVPVLWTGAIPSAHVTRDAYERIAGEIVDGIAAAGPLDGVCLDLHGAMVAEHLDDGEGELIARVRAVVGPDVPIAVSLDLHGNTTQLMVDEADLLVAFRTYPHVDMAETGRRAAEGLDRLMARGRSFAHAFRRLPYLTSIPWQCTFIEPAKSLYEEVAALETGPVASVSYWMGFPAADIEACGQTVLAYAETQDAADRAADQLYARIMEAEEAFAGRAWGPDEGVREAMRIAEGASRPVVIADTQDNPGAGGDSDTTGMLRALLRNGARRAAIGMIIDPLAALAAHAAGEGAEITIPLGGQSGVPGDAPFTGTFRVEKLSNGDLHATGPYYGGTHMNVGPSACLSIDGVKIVVATHKAQMADLAMYRFVGIEPTEMAILVNKSSVHFRADFDPVAETVLVCTAPGPMPLDPADLPWTKLADGMRLSPRGPVFRRSQSEPLMMEG